ncbi:hypothetical protein LTR62_002123 [Meristemomyces frigidus]|uniref:Ubiquitin carboxyl-terminal hydrolase n=1 Tax=Meristemomyces frigidus TaxID=1508187 RepID=A0AAN7T8T5_9PEZI|nr:hypothetical protein LTR62_002123 [Meristemomyces frigidus]
MTALPRGKKRKTPAASAPGQAINDNVPLTPPDRTTWNGWVEMESEPAFFNTMLTEMGCKGVRAQEVYDMDDEFLLTLPQPVHALIFLFRYKETDDEQKEAQPSVCPKEIWFANQVPEYACASFALLNIVNNIPGLELGDELRKFKEFTEDMDPLSRGDAVDEFEFLKHIHNSFASENDMLNADMMMKNKAAAWKKKQAHAKGVATKAAKRAKVVEVAEDEKKGEKTRSVPTSSTPRAKKPVSRKSPKETSQGRDEDDQDRSPSKVVPKVTTANVSQATSVRRSTRQPKPRRHMSAAPAPQAEAGEGAGGEGFHFRAYMPIADHVWKLDGVDRYPQDMGAYRPRTPAALLDSDTDNANELGWMEIAQPLLRDRMLQYAESEIQFNCMAVVQNPFENDKAVLAGNLRNLQEVDEKLHGTCEEWWELEGGETPSNVLTASALQFDIPAEDVESATPDPQFGAKLEAANDVLALLKLRQEILAQQAGMRASVRDSLASIKADEEKARHRRHDYGSFVRKWLVALARQEVLGELANS